MVDSLAAIFPKLANSAFQITSPDSDTYNCIAWAAEDTSQWWWPEDSDGTYWPPGIAREETLAAFQAVFASLGYAVCVGSDLEQEFDKVAIYALAGVPTHAARQLPSGRWTSKLGLRQDIEHDLHDLDGDAYGRAELFMRRARKG